MNLPLINESQVDYILSNVKNGLYDLVREVKMSDNNETIIADLNPDIVEKFSNKFPEANISELDDAIKWILIKSMLKQKEVKDGSTN